MLTGPPKSRSGAAACIGACIGMRAGTFDEVRGGALGEVRDAPPGSAVPGSASTWYSGA